MEINEEARKIEEDSVIYGQDPNGHYSTFSSKNACVCGRGLFKREDPFDLENANYRFFEHPCCSNVMARFYIPRKFIVAKFEHETGKNTSNIDDNSNISNIDNTKKGNEGKGKSISPKNVMVGNNEIGMSGNLQWHYEFGFDLLSMGGSEYYHKTKGLSLQPGFEKWNCFLMRWDIPVPSILYTFYLSHKSKTQRARDNCMCFLCAFCLIRFPLSLLMLFSVLLFCVVLAVW